MSRRHSYVAYKRARERREQYAARYAREKKRGRRMSAERRHDPTVDRAPSRFQVLGLCWIGCLLLAASSHPWWALAGFCVAPIALFSFSSSSAPPVGSRPRERLERPAWAVPDCPPESRAELVIDLLLSTGLVEDSVSARTLVDRQNG